MLILYLCLTTLYPYMDLVVWLYLTYDAYALLHLMPQRLPWRALAMVWCDRCTSQWASLSVSQKKAASARSVTYISSASLLYPGLRKCRCTYSLVLIDRLSGVKLARSGPPHNTANVCFTCLCMLLPAVVFWNEFCNCTKDTYIMPTDVARIALYHTTITVFMTSSVLDLCNLLLL